MKQQKKKHALLCAEQIHISLWAKLMLSGTEEQNAASKQWVHGLWRGQSFTGWLKSSHSLVKVLSRGFSMTEHGDSELLLLLLPGKYRSGWAPRKSQERRRRRRNKKYMLNIRSKGRKTNPKLLRDRLTLWCIGSGSFKSPAVQLHGLRINALRLADKCHFWGWAEKSTTQFLGLPKEVQFSLLQAMF